MLSSLGPLYSWFILPLLIFIARILDVSMGTVRVIFVSRGMKYLAPVMGFFEVLIWLLAIGQIMKNLSNPLCYIAYAGGFAMGNFVGMCIAEKLSLGMALLRVISKKDTASLIEDFKLQGYGVTSFDGQGSTGPVKLVFSIMHRSHLTEAVGVVSKFDPAAFYSIEDVGFVEKGVFAVKHRWYSNVLNGMFRPFRKGK
ncbi:MAG: DUF2179 domain-containing protein [Planctomycetes bacterium]|nr:DUF2179 domain-containing protein [Planctomycetota bacterium]MBU2457157.1 DUF2179 domain-containing protein [Planctomycetota bacterium]MBU2596346.1 DUF2179 domain-containing protein [Planctomycetota bacterium]